MTTIFINLFAFGTLLSSVFSITSKNPVISVIFLITTFVQAAGYLIIIGINFIGISYVVIYVGAIAILFLFVIMMINIKLTDILETGAQYTKNLPLAIAIGSLFIFIIFTQGGNKQFPNTGFFHKTHLSASAVPIVEITDDTDSFRVGRPNREQHAVNAVYVHGMRT